MPTGPLSLTRACRDRGGRPGALVAALTLVPAAVAALAVPAQAVDPGADTAPRNARVYVVVVDGLRPDEISAATTPQLAELAAEGTYLPDSRSVMVAETIPNHVAMVTGTYPDRNGIPANNFPDVTAPSDSNPAEGTGGSLEAGDPRLLNSDSIMTAVADQCPALTTAVVNSKDYLETIMEHDRNGDGRVDADFVFEPTEDPTFVPGLGLTLDERTMPEAIRVSRELDPHFLFLNLGSVDRIGHVDPTGGATSPLPGGAVPVGREAQLRTTDTLIRALVTELKTSGRWDSTAFMVTADHSMDFSLPTASVTLSDDIARDPLLTGEFVIAQNGGAALYSLTDRSDPQGPARLAKLREIAVGTDGVQEALYRQPNELDGGTAHWVGQVHPDWHLTGPRSGDLIVTVNPGRRISEPNPFVSNPIPGNHGMAVTQRIAMIVGGGIGVRQQRIDPGTQLGDSDRDPAQGENVDIAPTAAWLLGVGAPASGAFDGRVLQEAFVDRPAASCGATAVDPEPVVPETPSVALIVVVGAVLATAAVLVRRRGATA